MILTVLVFLNSIISLLTLLQIRSLRNHIKLSGPEQINHNQDQDIHSILNHRLLDLQHRTYSVQRRKS